MYLIYQQNFSYDLTFELSLKFQELESRSEADVELN